MPIHNVTEILSQIVSGELDQIQIEQMLDFLRSGIDITSLMM